MAKPLICPRAPSPLSEVMHEMPITDNMKSSGEPKASTSGRTIGNRQRERHRADQRAKQRTHQRRAEGASGFALFRHRIAIDDGRGGNRLAGHAEENRSDITGGRRHRMHAEQKGERLGRLHFENKGDHQGEGRRAADAGQQTDAEAKPHADQHQAESFPLKN